MSWSTRSQRERHALKGRRDERRTRSQRLEDQLWAEKRAAARTPEDKVALEYDRARALIRKVRDESRRAECWQRLQAALSEFNQRIGDGR